MGIILVLFFLFLLFLLNILPCSPLGLDAFTFLPAFERKEKKEVTLIHWAARECSIVKGRSLEGLGKTKFLGKFLFFFFSLFLSLDRAINLVRALQIAKSLHGCFA